MFQYIPASFVYTSQVTETERAEIDRVYMPFVLQNAHRQSRDSNNVRTDSFDRSAGPWGPFIDVMFRHFEVFARECLLTKGSQVVHFDPWFNYYASQSAMYHHSHPGNDFGVVYCLRNGARKRTMFDTFSHAYDSMKMLYPKLEPCRFYWDPAPGDFTFFPASLYHATELTEIDGERITLIANIRMKEEGHSAELTFKLDEQTPISPAS